MSAANQLPLFASADRVPSCKLSYADGRRLALLIANTHAGDHQEVIEAKDENSAEQIRRHADQVFPLS